MAPKPNRIKRINRNGDAPIAGVVITITPYRNTHVGIAYRDENDDVWMLHLAFHRDLKKDKLDSSYLCIDPELEDEDAESVAAHCRLIARDQPTISFALHVNQKARFGTSNGKVLLLREEKGLNCATFVLTVFRSAGPSLIDLNGWPARKADIGWHKRLVEMLRECGAHPSHIRRIAKDIGCVRVRPEEVAGACIEESGIPTTFDQCEANSHIVLAQLNSLTGRTLKANWV